MTYWARGLQGERPSAHNMRGCTSWGIATNTEGRQGMATAFGVLLLSTIFQGSFGICFKKY